MGKFIITEEEKRYIKSLYEQQTNTQSKIIEVTDGSVISQALVDGAPPPCVYNANRGTHDDKSQYIELCTEDGTCYRMRSFDFNFAGHETPGKLFAELNTYLLKSQKSKDGTVLSAFFGENDTPAKDIVKNSNDKWIGFKSSDKQLQFACFTTVNGKFQCSTFKWKPTQLNRFTKEYFEKNPKGTMAIDESGEPTSINGINLEDSPHEFGPFFYQGDGFGRGFKPGNFNYEYKTVKTMRNPSGELVIEVKNSSMSAMYFSVFS
jgi:hypothetical protein